MLRLYDGLKSESKIVTITKKDSTFQITKDVQTSPFRLIRIEERDRSYLRAKIKVNEREHTLIAEGSDEIYYLASIGLIKQNLFDRFSKKKEAVYVSAVFLFIAFVFYVYGLDIMVNFVINKIPRSYDTELGNLVFKQIDSKSLEIDSYSNSILTKIGNEFNRIHNDEFTIKLFVYDDIETINAFALPNGNIVLFKGLLHEIENQDELMAIIGHEIAHIKYRHGLKRLIRSSIITIVVTAFFEDVSGIFSIITENSNLLFELKYSRKQEHESDNYAISLADKMQYSPQALGDFFERLDEDKKGTVPEILSSHPNMTERAYRRYSSSKDYHSRILSKEEFEHLNNIEMIQEKK